MRSVHRVLVSSGHCSRLVAFRAGIVSCQPTWHHPRFRGSWVMVMALAAMHAKYVQPANQEPEGRKDTYCSAAGGTATTVLPPLKKAILWRCTRAPFLVCTARLLLFFFLGPCSAAGSVRRESAWCLAGMCNSIGTATTTPAGSALLQRQGYSASAPRCTEHPCRRSSGKLVSPSR